MKYLWWLWVKLVSKRTNYLDFGRVVHTHHRWWCFCNWCRGSHISSSCCRSRSNLCHKWWDTCRRSAACPLDNWCRNWRSSNRSGNYCCKSRNWESVINESDSCVFECAGVADVLALVEKEELAAPAGCAHLVSEARGALSPAVFALLFQRVEVLVQVTTLLTPVPPQHQRPRTRSATQSVCAARQTLHWTSRTEYTLLTRANLRLRLLVI